MAKSKANTTAGARPKASRREGRAPAAATAKAETGGSGPPGRSAAPTKQAAVIGLLQREGGATLADLVDATGWLAHTTRAALTRLRQAGHRLDKGKDETGATVYCRSRSLGLPRAERTGDELSCRRNERSPGRLWRRRQRYHS